MKDIENRAWKTNYRGRLLIHAAQQIDERGVWILGATRAIFKNDMDRLYKLPVIHRGYIIGAVDLIDCVTVSASKWFAGPCGFVLANPLRFKNPISYRGRLGIFEVPDEIIAGAL
jgi:hypothetical protein